MTHFEEIVTKLGFGCYADYLASGFWKKKKAQYREADSKQHPKHCLHCNNPLYVLHHLEYSRLGKEQLDDLMPLCDQCHTKLHELMSLYSWVSTRSKALDLLKLENKLPIAVIPRTSNPKLTLLFLELDSLLLRDLYLVRKWANKKIAQSEQVKQQRKIELELENLPHRHV